MVSAAVAEFGEVDVGKEEDKEEGDEESKVVVASDEATDEVMPDDNLPEEVVDAGAVVGEEEAAVVVSSSVVDVPEDAEAEEEVEAGVVLGVLEGAAVVDCSEAVVDSAVVDAGAEDEDEDESAVVDPAAELDDSPILIQLLVMMIKASRTWRCIRKYNLLELVSEAVVDPALEAVEDCASVDDCATELEEPGAVLVGPAAVVELLLLGPLPCLLAI